MKLIPLTKGCFAIVDAADYDDLIKYRWHLSKNGKHLYVRRFEKSNTPGGVKQKSIYMHRQITNPPTGMEVDHKNGDGLDNRRENLRVCTRRENSQNLRKSANCKNKYKGVYEMKNSHHCARIWNNGTKTHIGVYDTPEAAAIAYDKKAKELFGEFANLNFKE